jgi:UDP-N-acetylglucosamine 2-epimerase (non-hydrolysing)
MPEEYNRRLTDHLSNYLFAPTERAKSNLIKENITHNIFITGNTVIDAINQHVPLAEIKSTICEKIKFKRFAIATAHRAENVDNIEVLKNFIEAFSEAPIPIVYPIHPRTRKRLQQNNLLDKVENEKNIQLLPPLGYLDFLILMKNSELILTDSGGIQEEATAPAIKKPVLVLRLSTERQEAVEAGFATLVGIKKQEILKAIESVLNKNMALPQTSPFGNGDAAKRTIEILERKIFS